MLPSASLNGVGVPDDISQLDTWPACAPVNASPAIYDRRRMTRGQCGWLGLHLYDSFIHYFLPVFPAHRAQREPQVRSRRLRAPAELSE
jgi:hypothetical protein